jgi:hypothetical protein
VENAGVKCGELGYVNGAGRPCGQEISSKAKGCIFHDPAKRDRAKAAQIRGAHASRMQRYLPASSAPPEFLSTASIVAWAEQTAQRVLTGALDPRAAGEARQLAALTISARQADAQAALVDALLKLEHGGAAMMLLTRLQDGLSDGKRRPLPSARVVPMTPPSGDGA